MTRVVHGVPFTPCAFIPARPQGLRAGAPEHRRRSGKSTDPDGEGEGRRGPGRGDGALGGEDLVELLFLIIA